jgi:hypothetical protein
MLPLPGQCCAEPSPIFEGFGPRAKRKTVMFLLAIGIRGET